MYRWGNPAAYDQGLIVRDDVAWYQLDQRRYPGYGYLILYNNNYGNLTSAIFEIVPPLDTDSINYIINDTDPFGPEQIEWMYTGGFHSNVQSGAFRLQNGNTLISVADDAKIFEIDSAGITLWDYEYPGVNIMIARAQKYLLNSLEVTPQHSQIIQLGT